MHAYRFTDIGCLNIQHQVFTSVIDGAGLLFIRIVVGGWGWKKKEL